MKDIFLTSVFGLAIIAPIFLGVLALSLAAKRDERRVNPLTKSLRRPPGGHLSRQIVGSYFDLATTLTFLSLTVALPASIYMFQSHVLLKPDSILSRNCYWFTDNRYVDFPNQKVDSSKNADPSAPSRI